MSSTGTHISAARGGSTLTLIDADEYDKGLRLVFEIRCPRLAEPVTLSVQCSRKGTVYWSQQLGPAYGQVNLPPETDDLIERCITEEIARAKLAALLANRRRAI